MAKAAIKPKPIEPPSLLERIAELEAELEALIEARTDVLAASIRGLPRGTLRQEVTKNDHCGCRIAKRLLK